MIPIPKEVVDHMEQYCPSVCIITIKKRWDLYCRLTAEEFFRAIFAMQGRGMVDHLYQIHKTSISGGGSGDNYCLGAGKFEMRQECSKTKKVNAATIFEKHAPLFTVTRKGSKGMNSLCDFTALGLEVAHDYLLESGTKQFISENLLSNVEEATQSSITQTHSFLNPKIDCQSLSGYKIKKHSEIKSMFLEKTFNISLLKKRLKELCDAEKIHHIALENRGCLPTNFRISKTGRVTYLGANLQGCSKWVRKAACGDAFSYDIRNCALAVFLYEAGVCPDDPMAYPFCKNYMVDPETVRNEIAIGIGANPKAVKKCLTALLMGAKRSKGAWVSVDGKTGMSAIREEFYCEEVATKFVEHPDVVGIHEELKKLRKIVAKKYQNNMTIRKNCPFSGKPAAKFAHIYQGIESNYLEEFICHFHDKGIVVTVHDGVVTKQRISESERTEFCDMIGNPYLRYVEEEFHSFGGYARAQREKESEEFRQKQGLIEEAIKRGEKVALTAGF